VDETNAKWDLIAEEEFVADQKISLYAIALNTLFEKEDYTDLMKIDAEEAEYKAL
jgi:hypothetical protein